MNDDNIEAHEPAAAAADPVPTPRTEKTPAEVVAALTTYNTDLMAAVRSTYGHDNFAHLAREAAGIEAMNRQFADIIATSMPKIDVAALLPVIDVSSVYTAAMPKFDTMLTGFNKVLESHTSELAKAARDLTGAQTALLNLSSVYSNIVPKNLITPAVANIVAEVSRSLLAQNNAVFADVASIARTAVIDVDAMRRALVDVDTLGLSTRAPRDVVREILDDPSDVPPPPLNANGTLTDDAEEVGNWIAGLTAKVIDGLGLDERDLVEDAVATYAYTIVFLLVVGLLLNLPLAAVAMGLLGTGALPIASTASKISRRGYRALNKEPDSNDE